MQEVTSLPSALLSQEQSGLCVTADCKECVCVARLVLAVRRLNQCSLFCPSESFGGNAELQRSVDQKNMSCQLF